MNSTNQHQAQKNHQDLQARDAVEKIRDIVGEAGTCFFCTSVSNAHSGATRPMCVQQIDDAGNLWFLSADNSHKNLELATDPTVKLYFQGSPHSDFLQLDGRASVSRDKAKIKELWKPILKTWFAGGEDDPCITVIKVSPMDGYYWNNKHGNAVAGVKTMIGAALGKTLDDSIEGRISPWPQSLN